MVVQNVSFSLPAQEKKLCHQIRTCTSKTDVQFILLEKGLRKSTQQQQQHDMKNNYTTRTLRQSLAHAYFTNEWKVCAKVLLLFFHYE